MPYMSVNGYQLLVKLADKRKTTQKGSQSRSFRGWARDPRRNVKRTFNGTLCFLDFAEASKVEDIIHGRGHHVDLVDSWVCATALKNRTPLAASAIYDFYMDPQLVWPTFPKGGLVTRAGSFTLGFTARLGAKWTVMWREYNGVTERYVAKRSDGAQYINGVLDLVTIPAFSIGSPTTNVDFSNAWGGHYLSDVTMLPYEAPNAAIIAWQGVNERFSPLPVLKLSGDFIREDNIWCVGEITGADIIDKPREVSPFGWLNNAKLLSFELMEMGDTFVRDVVYPLEG